MMSSPHKHITSLTFFVRPSDHWGSMPQVTAVAKAHMLFDFIEPLVKDVEGITEDVDDEVS